MELTELNDRISRGNIGSAAAKKLRAALGVCGEGASLENVIAQSGVGAGVAKRVKGHGAPSQSRAPLTQF